MPHIEVLVGSLSDLHFVWDSELPDKLDKAGITCAVSACSAHRNLFDLIERVNATISKTAVYVCAAGWAAALPGTVKAILLGRSLATVFGVALPSEAYPDADDAKISIGRLPPGIDVEHDDNFGTEGFNSIANDVCDLAWAYDPRPDLEELQVVKDRIKPPQFDILRPKKGAS